MLDIQAARSARIIAIIASIATARTSSSHSPSGRPSNRGHISSRARHADAFQVVAGVKTLGDFADGLAQRLAVAQIGGTGQDIDLGAGVIDVIFAGDLVTGESQADWRARRQRRRRAHGRHAWDRSGSPKHIRH